MRVEKDFRYYGKKRFKVQRILRNYENTKKNDYSWYFCVISFIFVALIVNLEQIFKVDLGIIGGVLAMICITEFVWVFGHIIIYAICTKLDKYYWSKRVELFNKYLEEKKDQTRTRNNTNT